MLVVIVGALYVGIVLALSPCRGFWSGDAGVKLWQMEAWIANGWRTPWASYAGANAVLDPDHALAPLGAPFAVWEGDRVLTIYTLPYIFLSSLLLSAGGLPALYAPPLIAGVGGLALAAWVGRRFSGRVAFFVVLALGLASSWLFYSVTFWGHTLASVLIWGALTLVIPDMRQSRVLSGIAAGLCLGAAVATRPEAGTSVLALLAVLVVRRSMWPALGWVTAGLGLAGLVGWAYQAAVVGQAIGGQAAMNFAPSAFETRVWSFRRLFEMSQMVVESRQLGVLVILAGGLAVFGMAYAYRRLRPALAGRLGSTVECLGLVLVAVGAVVLVSRGYHPIDLLFGAPVACLAFLRFGERAESVATRGRWRRQLAVWCVWVVVLSVVLGRQSGGWQWGPRYLTPLLGPLVLLAVERWDRLERGARSSMERYAVRGALVTLLLAGAAVQAVGVMKLWHVRAGNDVLARTLLRAPDRTVVVTDLWFVPQIAPEVYGEVPFLVVRTPDEWSALDERLAAQGVGRVRVARLADQETPLVRSISAGWQVEAGTVSRVPTIPPLVIADYVPREP
ncbi:MAG: hypothetical protein JW918_10145 [Anaerolineae bacterium]|nr:hypothetical protein [Anaerolineae bacterium]